MSKPLLDFETLAPERPTIRVDGVAYEMALLGDFGLREQARLARLLAKATEIEKAVADHHAVQVGDPEIDQALAALDALGEEQAAEVVAYLDEVVEVVLPHCPANVRARLSERQQRAILEAFMPAVLGVAVPTLERRPAPLTSVPSQPTSRRRTARAGG
jgi:hypothetical protein